MPGRTAAGSLVLTLSHPRDRRGGYGLVVSRGRLITIEGLDGAGKSTLIEALRDALAAAGVEPVRCLREPGGVPISERIRELVKDPGLAVSERAEALLYAAARAQLVAELLSPLLAAGTWVLLDRFIDSSLAYQGAGRALGIADVRAINHFAAGELVPDRTLLLRVDPLTGRRRQRDRAQEPDRLEREDEQFFGRVAGAYEELARSEPQRIRVIDAEQTADGVLEQALCAIEDLLAEPAPVRSE